MAFVRIKEWFAERLPVSSLGSFFGKKYVPNHRHTFWYYFGGLTLFCFMVQFGTGILLTLYYSPTPETANESVNFITSQVPFGWLIRSVHKWSANLMVAFLLIHFFSTLFMRAYRKPRELLWVTGMIMLLITLGFAFTGYLLPWDTTAYFATQIGTEIPRSLPIAGEYIVSLLRGDDFIGAAALTRMFALHVVFLPLMSLILVAVHVGLNQIYGSSIPIGANLSRPQIKFFPDFFLRDLMAWTAAVLLLLCLSVFFPAGIGQKADPYTSAPTGIRPEWYFLSLFQTIRMLPAQLFGLNTEMLVNLAVQVVGIGLLIIPFADRKANQEEKNLTVTFIGIVLLLYVAITTFLGFL